ncbi:hypothetical protein Goklo_007496 [Gossypium klotzschianum]|uniref:DUF7745 domain-containing protein n=1 Tax=Gossypium klotzschianum TaxID=34286 RepID=A0A7J8W7Y0_9ROSI|nr:hypothetical protein [Gossypium klotzschianum]
MGNGFLDRVEDNAAVRTWVEMTQREKGRQASVSSSCPVLESDLQLFPIREGRFGTYNRRVHGFTSVFKDSSRHNLFESGKCTNLFEEDLILVHPDTKKKIDIFALSIYGMVVFPKALGHIDEAVTDLFDQLDKRVTPVPVDNVSYRVFSKSYSLLKEIVTTPRRDDISEEKWMVIFQNLQEEDIEWRALWLLPDEILYRCRDFDWVPLLGI